MSLEYQRFRKFFAPSAVAVVGATEDTSRFGGKVMSRLRTFGVQADVFPINPKAAEIDGRTCYGSLSELPRVPDHVGIMVPATKVFDVLDECARLSVPFATVFSSGFAETDTDEGRARHARLRDFARDSKVRVMGPNCNGIINFVDGFALTSSSTASARRPAGNIGLASQSGGAAQVNVMWRAQQIGLNFSYEVSCGNSADLDVLDFVGFMIDDPHTDVILVIAESLHSGIKLFETARKAAARQKPIVILKLGRTSEGSRAAASHTGALTGSDNAYDAAFKQCGIIRVDDCHELYEAAILLRNERLPQGRRLAALSASGGNAVLLADLGAQLGIEWPQYSAATQERLKGLLPQHGQANNPTDVTSAAIGKKDTYRQCVEAIAADPQVDAVVPILTLSQQSDVEQIVGTAKGVDKPIVILWTGGCTNNPELTPASLIERGTPVFRDAKACLRAFRNAVDYTAFLRCKDEALRPRERQGKHDVATARGLLGRASGTLTEHDAKRALAAYRLTGPAEVLTGSAEAAVAAAERIGAPVAVKIQSAQIPHKTEAGGVRLAVNGKQAVREAYEAIVASAKAYAPDAAIDGVLVQEMVGDNGLEMIVGVAPDPTFGHVVMAGFGGIYAEILQDVVFRIGPLAVADARAMLGELRGFELLRGARGQPPKDIDALCAAISNLSWLAHDFREQVREIDLNPIVVLPEGKGIRIVDALITLANDSIEAPGVARMEAV
jgi:acetyltransferase